MDIENVTFRKPRKSSSLNNISSSSSLFETTALSLPNTSIEENREIHEKIHKLTEDLSSANQEIENLSYENIKLKNEIERCKKIIEMYKKNAPQEINCSSPIIGRLKKKHKSFSATTSPISKHINSNLNIDKLIFGAPQSTDSTCPHQATHYLPLGLKNPQTQDINKLPLKETEIQTKAKDLSSTNLDKQTDKTSQLTDPQDPNTYQSTYYIPLEKKSQIQQDKNTIHNKYEIQTQVKVAHHTTTTPQYQEKLQVIIIADEQALGLGKKLQYLLGSKYLVKSFIKPNACLKNIIESMKSDILSLTKNDCVILLGGINDRNPYEFSFTFNLWLSSVKNTNVIVSEIPYNVYLNVKKLNYELGFLCDKYSNAEYIDLDYSRVLPHRGFFRTNLARSLLKEILRIYYKNSMDNYQASLPNYNCKTKSYNTVATQTKFTSEQCLDDKVNDFCFQKPSTSKCNCNNIDLISSNIKHSEDVVKDSDNFFRV